MFFLGRFSDEFWMVSHYMVTAPSLELTCPPGRPSFITRVLGVDSGRFRVWQARRVRSPQIAQAELPPENRTVTEATI